MEKKEIKRKLFGYGTFLLFLLGFLSAFGPFVTDMYLPALPQLQEYFGTDTSMVQLSLSTSMLGLAIGQIFIGPLSDKYGRRPLLIFSLWIFIVSTIVCIFSPSIEVFVALRFLQGVGGSGGIVLSRSIATDRYWGEKLAKMMAVIGAINGIAPVTAPVIGGMMTDSMGWRGIFWALMVVGILLVIGAHIMRESLKPENRSEEGIIRTFASFKKIFRNPRFVNIWLQYGFCGGVFFAYISSSPFIIQQHFGFSAMMFSFFFGFNAIMIGVGTTLSIKFKTPMRSTIFGNTTLLVAAIGELAVLTLNRPFWMFEILAVALLTGIGFCFNSSTVIALNEEHENAGAASALVGAILFAAGGVVSPIVGLGDITITTGIAFVVCSLMAMLFCLRSKKILSAK